jgi:FKBP-type peptidyl-prolyl cis-trans isomerase FkpA
MKLLSTLLGLATLAGAAHMTDADAAGPTDLPKAPVTSLHKIDRTVGSGTEATPGKSVQVHYTGWLYDPAAPEGHGKKFDSSLDRGQPFGFGLGAGMVIRGWDEGVAGMKIGGKRTLVIPPEMGYGARGAGGVIPPNATLIFDVELLGVR